METEEINSRGPFNIAIDFKKTKPGPLSFFREFPKKVVSTGKSQQENGYYQAHGTSFTANKDGKVFLPDHLSAKSGKSCEECRPINQVFIRKEGGLPVIGHKDTLYLLSVSIKTGFYQDRFFFQAVYTGYICSCYTDDPV